jgi:hypothetical protein
MTTKEMIEVMQAYEKGEEIERRLADCEDIWVPATSPYWNWDNFEYRVKPKEPKFKDGDEVVRKSFAGCSRPADIWHVGSLGMDGMNLSDFIKADDVLWYWEYQDVDGEWKMTDARYTKSDLSNEVLGPNERETAIPLYVLGFRLPREKDEE